MKNFREYLWNRSGRQMIFVVIGAVVAVAIWIFCFRNINPYIGIGMVVAGMFVFYLLEHLCVLLSLALDEQDDKDWFLEQAVLAEDKTLARMAIWAGANPHFFGYVPEKMRKFIAKYRSQKR